MLAAVMSSRTHLSLIGALALALAALSCSQQSTPSNPACAGVDQLHAAGRDRNESDDLPGQGRD
jgi:hypothetical protein